MDTGLYIAYRTICDELGLSPVAAGIFESLIEGEPRAAQVMRTGTTDSTWVLVREDRRDGCLQCLSTVGEFIEYFYSGDPESTFSELEASALLCAFHEAHDLSISVTNAYAAQNWSCVVPASDCLGCADARDGITPLALRAVPVVYRAADDEVSDTGGARTMSAEAFVGVNRWAFGFASVVGNPVSVPDLELVALVNAPIRTSARALDCEIAGGKGVSVEQALASCLGEAIERYVLATAVRTGMVVGPANSVERAIDVSATFGFPVRDSHPSISTLDDNTVLEWIDGVDLQGRSSVRVPTNFALCPYIAGSSMSIVAGSTNGAASGATAQDAKTQAVREIVERDAFWYYARTGVEPMHVAGGAIPTDVLDAMRSYRGTFAVAMLPNPFRAPVANVTFHADCGYQTKTARGSGHAATVTGSIRRAFAECVQMLQSLDSGIDVEPNETDMRNSWFTGRSRQEMPNLFKPLQGASGLDHIAAAFVEEQSLEDLLESAFRQGMTVINIPLVEEKGFSVSKVIMSGASVSDASYFASNARFSEFAKMMAHDEPEIRYTGSLFM